MRLTNTAKAIIREMLTSVLKARGAKYGTQAFNSVLNNSLELCENTSGSEGVKPSTLLMSIQTAADEIDRLTHAIRTIKLMLCIDAAEYVPAIGDVFKYIDSLELPCEYCGGSGSVKVDFEHPQWVPCGCRSGQQSATAEYRNEEDGR